MARSRWLKIAAIYILANIHPAVSGLAASTHAARHIGLLPRASPGCPSESYTACNNGLPGNFCCPAGNTCFVFNNQQSMVCCPTGTDCSTISSINCDMNFQNVTVSPTSPLLTTDLSGKMVSCGSKCCPVGYSCTNDAKGNQICAVNNPSSSPSASGAAPTSTTNSGSTPASSSGVSSFSPAPTSVATITPGGTAAAANSGSNTTSTKSNPFPPTAILVGFFSGLTAGILLTILLICCFGRTLAHKDNTRSTSDFSNVAATVSDPIYQPGSSAGRTDFLRRQSGAKTLNGSTSRVRSFFSRTNTMKSRHNHGEPGAYGMMQRSNTGMTSRSKSTAASSRIPKTPSTLRKEPSTESITIYSPPNLHGPQRLTTVGSLQGHMDGEDAPDQTDFREMLAKAGLEKDYGPYLGSPGRVDPRSRRIDDV